MPTDYPTEADLKKFLAATNLIENPPAGDDALLDFRAAVESAIEEWEAETGLKRITAAQTREFDPPSNREGLLDPGRPFAAVTAITIDGAVVAAADYLLLPENAPDEGRPYRFIQFVNRSFRAPTPWGLRSKLAVTALWGAGTTVAYSTWNAILARAASALFMQLMGRHSGFRRRWLEAGVTEEFDVDRFKELRDGWDAEFLRQSRRAGAGTGIA